jgi:hypothetical protein
MAPSQSKQRKPIPPGQYPSLVRAFARVSRAEEHLAELTRKVARLGQEQINAITFQANPNNPKEIQTNSPQPRVDFTFSVVIGEIVYNLRAALDYLVFETAALDSGCIIEGTQFPIERNKKGFRWRVNGGWLDGLNAAHVAAIERLQPYRGCNWTAVSETSPTSISTSRLSPDRANVNLPFISLIGIILAISPICRALYVAQ